MKRKVLILGFIILFSQVRVCAWDLMSPVGSRTAALGRCSVALSDFWSIHNNPAGVALWKDFSAGIAYENRFLMKELGYKNAAVVLPINIGSFGLSVSQFGYDKYNENKIGIAYARSFGPHLRMGIQLDYLLFKFTGDYTRRSTATFELGIQSNITDDLCVGVYLFNSIKVKIKSLNNERVPIIMRLGLSYNLTKDFIATCELEEDFEKNYQAGLGLEYKAVKNFFIRTGIRTYPNVYCLGIGYSYRWITLDVAAEIHQILGVSFQSSLIFRIKEKQRKEAL